MLLGPLEQRAPDDPEFTFYCPGCRFEHWFKTTGAEPRWAWNEDYEKPTITPSILVFAAFPEKRCHFFVRDGKIQYLNDCHHELKGKTVDMVSLEDAYK